MTTAKTLVVQPQRTPLRGRITVPGDKSISHRAVMFGALATGRSIIRNWLPAGDTIATLNAVQNMDVPAGVSRTSDQSWDLVIHGQGLRGLRPPAGVIDCRNAGTCMRLLAGILAGQSFASTLDGTKQLRRRPMKRIVAPLRAMGAAIDATNGTAPLSIRPAPLHGMTHTLSVASAQVKSALLLAGLYAAGETHIREPGPARDHTERMLGAMGVSLTRDNGTVSLQPAGELTPLDLTVPADMSSAAFPIVAALLVPHSEITITNVGLNPTRTGLIEILAQMGGQIAISDRRETGGEPAGELTMRFDELHAGTVAGEVVVRAIDEFPILAVAAAQASGATTVRDASELRHKEVDRIGVLANELRILGVPIVEHPDGFTVTGPQRFSGGTVDSHGDHRLGMSLAVAGLLADGETVIRDAGCIADSFPGFVDTMQALGADMTWA